jgi:hypothetical protein
VVSLRHYMGKRYTFEVYNVPGLTERERRHLAFVATVLAPRPYDTEKLFRHLFDNLIERITWNGRRGFRPLARLFKMDSDKDRRNDGSPLGHSHLVVQEGHNKPGVSPRQGSGDALDNGWDHMNDKMKSRKLWVTIIGNVLLGVAAAMEWIPRDQAVLLAGALNGTYLVSQGVADHRRP